jgi:hypothetical protein
MSDVSQGPGWWQASDGNWYSPEQAPGWSAAASIGQEKPKKPIFKKWWFWVIVGFVALAVIGNLTKKPTKNVAVVIATTTTTTHLLPTTTTSTRPRPSTTTTHPRTTTTTTTSRPRTTTTTTTRPPTTTTPTLSSDQKQANYRASAHSVSVSQLANTPSIYDGSVVTYQATIVNYKTVPAPREQ